VNLNGRAFSALDPQQGRRLDDLTDQAQIALREGNADARLFERLLDDDGDLAVDQVAVVEDVAPRPELELESAIAKVDEE
jgi:hypothetical protein